MYSGDRLRVRARVLLAAALAALPLGLLGEPAAACSCGVANLEKALADGETVAVVTRTDSGREETATFAVEASLGPRPPARLTGRPVGGSCGIGVQPGAVAAVVVARDEDGPHVGACRELDLVQVLARTQGKATPAPGGAVASVVAGEFGGSRLAGLDSSGRVVAWDGIDGAASRVAVCPGQERVVAFGRPTVPFDPGAIPGDVRGGPMEMTVHQTSALELIRRTALQPLAHEQVLAAQCLDPAAEAVQVLLGIAGYPARLLRVGAEASVLREPGILSAAAALPDGFIAAVDALTPLLVRFDADGKQRTLTELPERVNSMAVSADGRTVAVYIDSETEPAVVQTHDTGTGRLLGRWTSDSLFVTGMGWTDDGRLLVRRYVDPVGAQVRPTVFDPQMRPLGEWATVPDHSTGQFGATRDLALSYGAGRLTFTPQNGPPQVVASPRLARAAQVVVLEPAAATTGSAAPKRDSDPAVWSVLAGIVVLAVGGNVWLRTRRRS